MRYKIDILKEELKELMTEHEERSDLCKSDYREAL